MNEIFRSFIDGWTNFLILLLSFYNFTVLIVKWSKVNRCFQRLYFQGDFCHTLFFEVLSFGVLDLILVLLIFTSLFAFIELAFIHPDTCPWVWLKIVCGLYKNCTYWFASPLGLRKFLSRVPVGFKFLLTSIYCFDWYKISFNLIAQAFFCLLSTRLFEFNGWDIIDPENCHQV